MIRFYITPIQIVVAGVIVRFHPSIAANHVTDRTGLVAQQQRKRIGRCGFP